MQLLLVEWHGGRHLPQEAASDALKGEFTWGWHRVLSFDYNLSLDEESGCLMSLNGSVASFLDEDAGTR